MVEFAKVSGFCLYNVAPCLQFSNFINGLSRSTKNLQYFKGLGFRVFHVCSIPTLVWVLKV